MYNIDKTKTSCSPVLHCMIAFATFYISHMILCYFKTSILVLRDKPKCSNGILPELLPWTCIRLGSEM